MPEPDAAADSFPTYARWMRVLGRLGGLIAVILGGWSLWLAFSTVNKPDEIEALNEILEEADDLPAVLRPASPQSKPVVQFTDVAMNAVDDDSASVEPAEFVSTNESPPDTVAVASFSTEESDDAAGDSSNSAAAWLTGEIEDAETQSELVASPVENVRPWKRTTKSLKTTMRSPQSVPRR